MPRPFNRFKSTSCPVRSGFSLVELLVVIAVIGVLMALIVAAVSSAKSRAQQAAGAAVMRGIGTAVLLYANEHGGRLPGPLFSNQVATRGTETGNLVNRLASYFNADDLEIGSIVHGFANPALEGHGENWKIVPHYYLIHHPRDRNGNWMTWVRLWGGHPSVGDTPLPMTAIEYPGKTMILIDNDNQLIRLIDYPPGLPGPQADLNPVYKRNRNALFLDGSVRSLSISPQSP